MRILVADDEPEMTMVLEALLSREHYSVDVVYNGQDALDYGLAENYDCLVLDIMMPKLDGIQVLRELRARNVSTPVLLLTAKSQVEDRIAGLNSGADDYLPKPYDIGVLIARVEARLRAGRREKRFFHFGALRLDTAARIGYCGAQELTLTQKEFSLLLQLAQSGGQIIAKEDLYERVWGRALAGDSTALYTAVSRLNTKLTESGAQVTIRFLRGKGYTLEAV